MTKKDEVLRELGETGIIAVIRVNNPKDLISTAYALLEGGVKFLEFTMTIPGALDIVKDVTKQIKEGAHIGVGTVLDAETARAAILAGAQFVVSPICTRELVEVCRRYSITVIPGGYTPNEIFTAWQMGADVVKVFSAGIGGPSYFNDLKGPFPHIEILPTGGVNLETAPQFIKAGAYAVAVGKALVSNELIVSGNYNQITENAQKFSNVIRQTKESMKNK